VKTMELKLELLPVHVVAVGSQPSGSFIPKVKILSESISGPPWAPAARRLPAERSMIWAV